MGRQEMPVLGTFLVTGTFGSVQPRLDRDGGSKGTGVRRFQSVTSGQAPLSNHLFSQEPMGLSKHALILQWECYAFRSCFDPRDQCALHHILHEEGGDRQDQRKPGGPAYQMLCLEAKSILAFSPQDKVKLLCNSRYPGSNQLPACVQDILYSRGRAWGTAHRPRVFQGFVCYQTALIIM